MTMILDGTKGGTFPSWTTAGRPASPAVGQIGYNTTTGNFDAYTAVGWVTVVPSSGMTSAFAPSTTAGIAGTTSGNDANSGSVGEYIEAVAGATVVTTSGTAMTSITLTAGDWDIAGSAQYYGASGTSEISAAINTTSGSISGTLGKNRGNAACYSTNGIGQAHVVRYRVNITSTTTYYLNAATITSSQTLYGSISARRMR